MNIGAFIREKRIERGLTQADLAQRLGYSGRAYFANIERGYRTLKLADFIKLAWVFDMTPSQLMTEAENLNYVN